MIVKNKPVSKANITDVEILNAAAIIKNGGLVAFPTETVYGLGGDAFNPAAVSKIYSIKGRPADNPLILHVENEAAVKNIAEEVNGLAGILMKNFWPGPLTLIFKKKPGLPEWVGGHPDRNTGTVALRAPSNSLAQALIKKSGCVIAAPSANKSQTPSPTRAEHVTADFGPELCVLDGGETVYGLESTVVDVTGKIPCVLRPGGVTVEMLEAALGRPVDTPAVKPDGPPLSPGMKYRHYAPSAPMTLVCGEPHKAAEYITDKILKTTFGTKLGILATEQTVEIYLARFKHDNDVYIQNLGDREIPETVAHNLYNCLRQFDKVGVNEIFAEGVEGSGLGQAIMNRMKKASEGRVVCVS